MSIDFINIIIRLIIYSLLYLIFKLFNVTPTPIIFKYFVINILFISLINFIFLNIYVLSKKNIVFAFTILLGFLFSINLFIHDFDLLNLNIYYLLLLVVILILFSYFLIKNKFIKILE